MNFRKNFVSLPLMCRAGGLHDCPGGANVMIFMEKFEVNILGCGSAVPTIQHFPAAQVVNVREKLFMIDCGEGAQHQFRKMRLKFQSLGHIFISHLHGDHFFGLPGLISTFGMLGRTADMHIHAHRDLEALLKPVLDYCCKGMDYKVIFDPLPEEVYQQPCLIYEDRSLTVYTIPLRHRMPSCGFLFREKPLLPHIRRDMVDFLKIPSTRIAAIKAGEGWTTEEGDFYPNERLVTPADPPRSYAYCSDTCQLLQNAEQLRGVDLLYHEATFSEELAPRAEQTQHSTARQAAEVAKAAGVKRLLIGHYSKRYTDSTVLLNEARAVFPDTLAANEGLCIQV